ncbi:MAG TPA: aldehyde:ferredoxin oxidoreductase [Candidatus Wallbacteria bacterium]|nr:aldehyde:ferredoxin oxidoreductase [Candidatus Wallbacteria bacterium]
MKSAHKILKEFTYSPKAVNKGYSGETLYVNLSTNEIKIKTVTDQMKNIFIGGRGFGLWYLWNAVTPKTKWNDPENEIIISPGPIAGITQYPGAGKSLVVSLSPLTGSAMDSNVGGYFGPYMKFSGFDALELQGKAAKDVVLFIDGDNGRVTIEEAPLEDVDSHLVCEQLTEMYAKDEQDRLHVATVASGTAAEHTLIGHLNFSFYDRRRKGTRLKQAGRGGIGTIFRDKKIKGLVVRTTNIKGNSNNPADQELLNKTGIKLHKEIRSNDDKQCHMRTQGTAHLVEIMSDYDLLPVNNFKYGSHEKARQMASWVWGQKFTQGIPDGCWFGCTMACAKAIDGFELKTGPYKGHKVIVDGPEYETVAGVGSCCGIFDPDAVVEINFYCDTYGVDTISFGTLTAFAMECFENKLITEKETGGLKLNFGNHEASLELLHQMGRGEGFGKIAGLGVRKMKQYFAEHFKADPKFMQDIGMECKGLEYSQYVSKESLAQQGGYALTNKGPQHDEAWLIFMDMVNNHIPTFENKAEALHYFPLFRTWFGLNGLCKLPWNDVEPEDNPKTAEPAKVPEHVQNYVNLFNGVTGKKIDKDELIRMSERVYNFQRVFNLKMGFGTREHDIPPYRSIGPVTCEEYESRKDRYDKQLKEKAGVDPAGLSTEDKVKKMREYREKQYQMLVDAVYKRRGWNERGIPKPETLKALSIDFEDVMGLVKSKI